MARGQNQGRRKSRRLKRFRRKRVKISGQNCKGVQRWTPFLFGNQFNVKLSRRLFISIFAKLVKQCEDATMGINPKKTKPHHHRRESKRGRPFRTLQRREKRSDGTTCHDQCAAEKDGTSLAKISNSGATTRWVGCCLLKPFVKFIIHNRAMLIGLI
jgi:hypothetical protein